MLFYPDVFRKLIRAYKVERTAPPSRWCRSLPSCRATTRCFGLARWCSGLTAPCTSSIGDTDSGGAGQLWGDGKHGRVYRLTWSGTQDEPALAPRSMDSWDAIAKMSDENLIKALRGPMPAIASRPSKHFANAGTRTGPPFLKVLARPDQVEFSRYAALGVLHSFWNDDVRKVCTDLLMVGEADLRRLCAEALGMNAAPGDKEVHAALLKVLSDPGPAVRRAVALAMSRVALLPRPRTWSIRWPSMTARMFISATAWCGPSKASVKPGSNGSSPWRNPASRKNSTWSWTRSPACGRVPLSRPFRHCSRTPISASSSARH